ncbi:MAG: Hsp33 family molecular chaperone HslO [Lachnospiraceae bacterium]|nr:Hsp33 family molecular chaperone HslO [Lachnospiraceae bacterium]
MDKSDHIVIATAADGQIRAYAASTRGICEDARKAHNTSPIATAALGRLMTAGAMMGLMLKNPTDLLTLQIRGDGPVKGITVTADADANVKGFVKVPDVMLPPNRMGKLDVGGAVGKGVLSVIKDLGLKDPYIGQVELQTGEIADDLTYYYAVSEQTPSAVSLGVLMEKNNTVKQAGGFIIQLMPGISDEIVDKLEGNLRTVPSATAMLDSGMSPEDMLKSVLSEFRLEILDTRPARFKCNCSAERIEKVLISVGKEELVDMIKDGKPVEVKCQFCNKSYSFDTEKLKELVKKL